MFHLIGIGRICDDSILIPSSSLRRPLRLTCCVVCEAAAGAVHRWAQRESKLKELPGFVNFNMLRRDAETADDGFNFISCTVRTAVAPSAETT
jgi:hypothetical protein